MILELFDWTGLQVRCHPISLDRLKRLLLDAIDGVVAGLPPRPLALFPYMTPSLPQDRLLVDRGDGVRYVAGELLVRFSPEVGQALALTPDVSDDGATTHFFDRLHATWGSADPETGIAEYHYCIGTAAGACDTVSWTSMGTLTETTKTGLSLVDGETYYVSVKARNGADQREPTSISIWWSANHDPISASRVTFRLPKSKIL